jgi:hypothetical protein
MRSAAFLGRTRKCGAEEELAEEDTGNRPFYQNAPRGEAFFARPIAPFRIFYAAYMRADNSLSPRRGKGREEQIPSKTPFAFFATLR